MPKGLTGVPPDRRPSEVTPRAVCLLRLHEKTFLLLPAFVVRLEVMFSQVCLCSTFREGYPIQLMGVPHSRSGQGRVPHPADRGYPILLHQGYPIPGLDGRGSVAHLWSGWGSTPSQVWMGRYPRVPPRTRWDTPPLPSQDWMGYPPPQLDRAAYQALAMQRA